MLLGIKSPLGYPHFNYTLSQDTLYVKYMRRDSNRWVGLTFHYPLIWCPTKSYKATFLGRNIE